MIKTNASLVPTAEDTTLPICKCGCGQPVTRPGNAYLKGHQRRNQAIRNHLLSEVNDLAICALCALDYNIGRGLAKQGDEPK